MKGFLLMNLTVHAEKEIIKILTAVSDIHCFINKLRT